MARQDALPKAYDPASVEEAIYHAWEASGAFNPDTLPERHQKGEPYAIVMPPPNVTGTLHMGHAAMLAIEDLMIRFERMRGKKTLWIPGTDHAAIATQVKVEQRLQEQGIAFPRQELGREKFLNEVEKFADASKRTIEDQIRKMGSSCDWSRKRYTLDVDRTRAVSAVFKMMFDDGLIERGDRIVHWDPNMQTNVSDDEIEWREEQTPFYTFKYGPFEIGTSRPETKFGDKFVVMHPDDERYASYKNGDTFTCEWINGPITATILKDASVDPAFGSGVMTITPWHDSADFDIAERHHLPRECVIDLHGRLMPIAGDLAGQPIEKARPLVVEKLRAKGLVVSVDEKYTHRLATNYRGGGVIEPQIMRQWFVRVNKQFVLRQDTLGRWKKGERVTLKELMVETVRSEKTNIVPERFIKVYFHWIDQLRDWCISRQLWFGQRIPVWYRGEEMRVSDTAPGAEWEQDPDTLDTWFSSGLWSFSALGWPGDEWHTLRTFHPTAVLETGYDILFFWVARMVLMATYVIGEQPFSLVYLHGLVRDEQGRKMSKSIGNVMNPLDLIPKYGTDAVRLALVIGTTPGQDVKLSESKIEGYRNFTNKLWNISRFILSTMDVVGARGQPEPQTAADHWILSRLQSVTVQVTQQLSQSKFSAAGEVLRDFTWGDLADWYLEVAKVEKGKDVILSHVLSSVLRLWHPFMPFITEHVWSLAQEEGLLLLAPWPADVSQTSVAQVEMFDAFRSVVFDIRRLRAEQKVPGAHPVDVRLSVNERFADAIKAHEAAMKRMAHIASFEIVGGVDMPEGGASMATSYGWISLLATSPVDDEALRIRAKKELEEIEEYIESTGKKLENQDFLAKAPTRVVEEMKKKLADASAKADGIRKKSSFS